MKIQTLTNTKTTKISQIDFARKSGLIFEKSTIKNNGKEAIKFKIPPNCLEKHVKLFVDFRNCALIPNPLNLHCFSSPIFIKKKNNK